MSMDSLPSFPDRHTFPDNQIWTSATGHLYGNALDMKRNIYDIVKNSEIGKSFERSIPHAPNSPRDIVFSPAIYERWLNFPVGMEMCQVSIR